MQLIKTEYLNHLTVNMRQTVDISYSISLGQIPSFGLSGQSFLTDLQWTDSKKKWDFCTKRQNID